MDFEYTPAQEQLRAKIRTSPEQMTSERSAAVSEQIDYDIEMVCTLGVLVAR
jgi:hypothetical protein